MLAMPTLREAPKSVVRTSTLPTVFAAPPDVCHGVVLAAVRVNVKMLNAVDVMLRGENGHQRTPAWYERKSCQSVLSNSEKSSSVASGNGGMFVSILGLATAETNGGVLNLFSDAIGA